MADKSIDQLNAAERIYASDLFVLQQSGTAKKLTGQVLENWLVSFADGHGGIHSIEKISTSGLVDTYRITLADTTIFDFAVTNGRSVNTISKTSTSGLVDTYTISYNDGTTSTFTVKNGEKGDKGDNSYVWIKYSSQEPTEASHSIGDIPDNWIGIYSGNASAAPSDWTLYKWFQIKGEQGNTGDPASLIRAEVTYQVSDSGTIIPYGEWVTSIPVVPQGKYLWARTVQQYNTGSPITAYNVSRMGMDGLGSVVSVSGISPDENGNVPLTASDLTALPTTGGTMTGPINMGGQPITGLNEPTSDTEATRKSYVDKRVPLDGSQAMTGNLSMGGNRVMGLGVPEDLSDAATKGYVDGKTRFFSVTLSAQGWANQRQSVSINGVTADNSTHVLVSPNPSIAAQYAAYSENGVYCASQGDGVLTFVCDSVPDVDVTVNIALMFEGTSNFPGSSLPNAEEAMF